MNVTTAAIFVGVWVGTGLLAGLWLARRGHSALWTVVAAVLGPLFVPIARERAKQHPRLVASAPEEPPPAPAAARSDAAPRHGLRVLVGLDESAESRQALDTALAVLGDRCETLVLAEVIGHDSADQQDEALDAATSRLASVASRLPGSVSYQVLAGRPAEALRQFAKEQDMDLAVVGRRGQGVSTRLLGSVCIDLVKSCETPVLLPEPVRRGQETATTGDEFAQSR